MYFIFVLVYLLLLLLFRYFLINEKVYELRCFNENNYTVCE